MFILRKHTVSPKEAGNKTFCAPQTQSVLKMCIKILADTLIHIADRMGSVSLAQGHFVRIHGCCCNQAL